MGKQRVKQKLKKKNSAKRQNRQHNLKPNGSNKYQSENIKKKNKVFKKPSILQGSSEKLLDKCRENLKASHFRYMNEQLYSSHSDNAAKIFEDSNLYDAYHIGYKQQIEKWTINPLNQIIKQIINLPKDYIIADFGCGEGLLSKSITNKVYSIDLVGLFKDVIICDMACTPLDHTSIDVAVYCLSLMNTNLKDIILECNRVLKNDGILLIAEVMSRFKNVNKFLSGMLKCGFKCEKRDLKDNMFYFFKFRKAHKVYKNTPNIQEFSLKPCWYKKR